MHAFTVRQLLWLICVGLLGLLQNDTGFKLEVVTVRKLVFESDPFAFADQVRYQLQRWPCSNPPSLRAYLLRQRTLHLKNFFSLHGGLLLEKR